MGRKSKDLDFAVVAPSYDDMILEIGKRGGKIYLARPEYLTVRARMFWPLTNKGKEVDADFVLCRKDGFYGDGRRPDSVEIGTLEDDLARRDFTVNAIALTEDGQYVDPFQGLEDLKRMELRTVGHAEDRFSEDALRLLRAIRFSITHGFILSNDIRDCLHSKDMINLLDNVSEERIKDELENMFRANTYNALDWFTHLDWLRKQVFRRSIWLMPTMRER